VQTIKGLAGSGLGRAEREDNIKSARPQLKYAKGTPLAPFVTKKLKRTLGPVFRTDVRRSILNVQLNGGNIEVAFDQGKIVAGRHAEPISEIELELKQGRAEDIAELARKLRANVPLSFGARTKADRGYALKAGKVDEPVYAAPVSLKPEQSAGSAFTQIGLSCLQHLAANERGVRAGDAEGIHQMRVGLRRLRAAISIFGDIVRGRDTDALKQELKWLTEELGPARDLDVLAKEAVAPLREANPDRSEIAGLDKDVKRKRADEFKRSSDAVASDRFRDVVLTAALWLLDGNWSQSKRGTSARLRYKSIAAVVTDVLDHRSRNIIKKLKRLRELDPVQRHKLRIAMKKFRYGCDFFESLFDHAKAQKQYGRALKEVQGCLGKLNDIEVHSRRGRHLANPHKAGRQQSQKTYAMGLLTGQEQAKHRRRSRRQAERSRTRARSGETTVHTSFWHDPPGYELFAASLAQALPAPLLPGYRARVYRKCMARSCRIDLPAPAGEARASGFNGPHCGPGRAGPAAVRRAFWSRVIPHGLKLRGHA
jgi:inorganic triphosphatase YgiF